MEFSGDVEASQATISEGEELDVLPSRRAAEWRPSDALQMVGTWTAAATRTDSCSLRGRDQTRKGGKKERGKKREEKRKGKKRELDR